MTILIIELSQSPSSSSSSSYAFNEKASALANKDTPTAKALDRWKLRGKL